MTDTRNDIRVLLVDGGGGTLKATERSLGQWQVRTVASGEEALTELQEQFEPDVVITDANLSQMDGVTLLGAVRELSPQSARIIVADFRNDDDAARSVPVAHQFLRTPARSEDVIDSTIRCVEVQRRLHSPGMAKLLASVDVLPAPPAGVTELNRLLADPDSTVSDVAEVVATDPAMTAKLLQLVNSAYFGLGHRVTDAQHAVAYLGLTTVRNLLTSVELVRSFTAPDPSLDGAVEAITEHSMQVADLSRRLVGRHHSAHDAFAAGMVHDIGQLALLGAAPDQFRDLRDAVVRGGQDMDRCEVEIFGARHTEIGAALMTLWGLPFSMVEAVARSHDADSLPNPIELTAVHAVFVAEHVLNLKRPINQMRESMEFPNPDYLQSLGVDGTVEQLIAGTAPV